MCMCVCLCMCVSVHVSVHVCVYVFVRLGVKYYMKLHLDNEEMCVGVMASVQLTSERIELITKSWALVKTDLRGNGVNFFIK